MEVEHDLAIGRLVVLAETFSLRLRRQSEAFGLATQHCTLRTFTKSEVIFQQGEKGHLENLGCG